MNNTIRRCSKRRIHHPRKVTAVKRMSRAAPKYEVGAFRPVGRQPELGGLKKARGGALKPVVRGNKAGSSGDIEL
jgi:hypothetical protein